MCKLLISKFLINGFKLVLNFLSTSWSFANFTGVAGGAVRPVEKQPNRRLSEGWWGLQNDFANRWNRELGLFWGRNKVVNYCLGGPHPPPFRQGKKMANRHLPGRCVGNATSFTKKHEQRKHMVKLLSKPTLTKHWNWIAWLHLDIRTMI